MNSLKHTAGGYNADLLGRMRERITFVQPGSANNNSLTKPATPDVTLDTIYAAVEQISAAERAAAGRQTYIETRNFIIRYQTSLNATQIIVWRGRRYDIEEIEDIDTDKAFVKVVAALRI